MICSSRWRHCGKPAAGGAGHLGPGRGCAAVQQRHQLQHVAHTKGDVLAAGSTSSNKEEEHCHVARNWSGMCACGMRQQVGYCQSCPTGGSIEEHLKGTAASSRRPLAGSSLK